MKGISPLKMEWLRYAGFCCFQSGSSPNELIGFRAAIPEFDAKENPQKP